MNQLNLSQLRDRAPAIFAESPHSRVSDKYEFVSTMQVVEDMMSLKWCPVTARQDAVKKEGHEQYATHLLKFQHSDYRDDNNALEFILINNHMARKSLRFYSGYCIFACSNGLVTGDITAAIRAVHLEYSVQHLKEAMHTIMERASSEQNEIKLYKSIELTQADEQKFAQKAIDIRWKKGTLVKPQDILMVRRPTDDNRSLWTVFNRVQENVVEKAVSFDMTNGQEEYKDMTRPIGNISRNVNINMELWQLMVMFAAKYTKRRK